MGLFFLSIMVQKTTTSAPGKRMATAEQAEMGWEGNPSWGRAVVHSCRRAGAQQQNGDKLSHNSSLCSGHTARREAAVPPGLLHPSAPRSSQAAQAAQRPLPAHCAGPPAVSPPALSPS